MTINAWVLRCCTGVVLATGGLTPGGSAAAQAVLDRSPNLSGGWVGSPGMVHFNFLHRFSVSDAPERKVSSAPTLLLAAGLPSRILLGIHYASNSRLSPGYPNEWEFFGRYAPVRQALGAPVDLSGQLGYNLAGEGLDGELSVARREGPVRLIAAGRLLSDPTGEKDVQAAVAAGAALRLGRYLALSADAGTVTQRRPGEKVAWGVGLQLIIPHSPHGISLHATNSNNATLQAASRGTDEVRYGFEFTIPITLSRYFGRRRSQAVESEPAPADTPASGSDTVRAGIEQFAFSPGRIEVAAGTLIVWENRAELDHTVTADDRTFDSGAIVPGASRGIVFATPGTYHFHCTPHPFMRGTVVVR